jgi:succinate dehydrogenase/fumarate reductase-like Fe-S protein
MASTIIEPATLIAFPRLQLADHGVAEGDHLGLYCGCVRAAADVIAAAADLAETAVVDTVVDLVVDGSARASSAHPHSVRAATVGACDVMVSCRQSCAAVSTRA